MAKKFENKDLFDEDLFAKTTKDAEGLIKALNEIEDGLKSLAKVELDKLHKANTKTVKGIVEQEESIKKLSKAQEINEKIIKDKIKLEARVQELNSDKIQENEVLKVQASEQRKINKQLAKEQLGLVDSYQKQSKRLRDLRKEFKSLRIEEGKSTKATRALKREIDELDAELKDVDAEAGQFQRNVGNYPGTMRDAAVSIGKMAAAAVAAKFSLQTLQDSFEENEESADEFAKVSGFLGGAFDVLKNRIGGATSALVDIFTGSGNPIVAFNKFQAAFKGVSEALKEGGKRGAEYAVEARNIGKELRPLNEELAIINGNLEAQNALAGDQTRSFDVIEKAIREVTRLQIERALVQEKIAETELKLIQDQIDAKGEGANIEELLNQKSERTIQLQEARNELQVAQIENEKILREVQRDRFERELDFAIDAFDSQKTVNERQIADERLTLDQRRQILEETQRLTESSFQSQIQLVRDYTGEVVDLNALANESNEEAIRTELRKFNFDDITLGRILEIVRERKLALQDLSDAQKDLNEAERESVELRTDIISQEIALAKGGLENLEELEEQRVRNQISILRNRLEIVKKGSIEELRIRQELNDLLIEQERERLEKELELNEENDKKKQELLEKQRELVRDSINLISDIAGDAFSESISKIDDQLSALDGRVSQLQAKAAEGNLAAEQSLAEEEKKRAELEQKRERARKQQQQSQAFFTVLETYQSKVAAGDPSPLTSTIRDVAVLRGIAQSLGSFYEGTDDLGKESSKIDGKGGRLIVAHDNEQIWSKKDRDAVGWRNRDEIKEIVQMHDSGIMGKIMGYDTAELRQTSINIDNKRLETEIKKVNRSIQGIKIPEGTVSIDEVRKLINVKMRKGNKVTTERSRLHD